ncbi:hypothetical protein [Marinibactrum halimedae]|uniref:Uncharacterized protein n=1 Tax=Marinibactrum halimedae TaxID=1444977 RepID=A0AA37T4H4_9GAMM|nr:hypothetical protein [Marinibactrum halimedae]MCD9457476.1 hypothetical protein [Marinibactrum halimedae]GLS25471.1 hypothetical protein GCM10007877_11850 [Marinibactrum halimedae]
MGSFLTIAEGNPNFATPVSLTFEGDRVVHKQNAGKIVRTVYQHYPEWLDYCRKTSPESMQKLQEMKNKPRVLYPAKMYTQLEFEELQDAFQQGDSAYQKHPNGLESVYYPGQNEIWIFGVDAKNSAHISSALDIAEARIGGTFSKSETIKSVYIKNLNADSNDPQDNMQLYKDVFEAVKATAQEVIGHGGQICCRTISHPLNPKLRVEHLQQAYEEAGAQGFRTGQLCNEQGRGVSMISADNPRQDGKVRTASVFVHLNEGFFTV